MKKAILVVCMAFCCVVVRGNAADAVVYGPVKTGETLYRIALKHQQQGVTVSQMMTSIFEANPDAFEQGDINRLKVGSTLSIPDLGTVPAPAASAQETGEVQLQDVTALPIGETSQASSLTATRMVVLLSCREAAFLFPVLNGIPYFILSGLEICLSVCA